MKKILMVAAFFAAAIFTSYATDYFVSPTGNDGNSGLEEKKPFATLGKVMPLLKPANKKWVNEEYTDADFESIDMNVLRAQRNADGTYSKETLQFMLLKNNPNSYGVRAGKYLEAIANAKKISGAE